MASMKASSFLPLLACAFSLISNTADAPSVTGDELPAVIVPSASKTGGRGEPFQRSVCGRPMSPVEALRPAQSYTPSRSRPPRYGDWRGLSHPGVLSIYPTPGRDLRVLTHGETSARFRRRCSGPIRSATRRRQRCRPISFRRDRVGDDEANRPQAGDAVGGNRLRSMLRGWQICLFRKRFPVRDSVCRARG